MPPTVRAALLALGLLVHATVSVAAPARADTIYAGGPVVTMDPAHPRAGAVAVGGGRILAVGEPAAIAAAWRGPATRTVDLAGRTLLPGFIDGHSHISHALSMIDWANVAIPPVGAVDSIPRLLEALRAHAVAKGLREGDWVLGWGYDPDGLAEHRQLTRDDLDAVFPRNPVFLLHVSGHGGVLNSAAFALAGIDASTPTPPGGVIVRKPGSQEPAGLVMETAMMPAQRVLPRPDEEQNLAALDRVQAEYARNGYTTIQDGATDAALIALLKRAAAEHKLRLDVVSLPVVFDPAAPEAKQRFGVYDRRLKFGGIKIVTDGSVQGKTGWFTAPTLTGGPGGEPDWRGKPFLPEAQYVALVKHFYALGVPVWTHANGDAAIDMVIRAHEAAGARAADDRRDVVIHSQFVRPDQLDAYARLGLGASFFTNHAFYWADVHRRNLGEARARFLSPLRAATERGIRFSNHTDFGVTPLDPAMMLWTAVARESRSGWIAGPDQRVSALEALNAITLGAAWLYREEGSKGSIEPGKLADFVVLDANPLDVPVAALRRLRVVATIKEGVPVHGTL